MKKADVHFVHANGERLGGARSSSPASLARVVDRSPREHRRSCGQRLAEDECHVCEGDVRRKVR